MTRTFVSGSVIEHRILILREQRVMLDSNLAALYGVKTRHLNEQVKRNRERFPEDFVFQLTEQERGGLKLPLGRRRGHRPYAFTEQGAGMLASVLRGSLASRISIEVLRTFARLRQDENPPPSSPSIRKARSLFAAIRNVAAMVPELDQYTTSEPSTYFLQAGDGGPIKIGSTKNLAVRLRTLCMMSPVPLRLLGVIEGEDAEDRCHFRLGAFRLHGEWFAPSPVVIEFIRQNASEREANGL